MGDIRVFVSSVTGNKEMKGQMQRIRMVLESKNIDFKEVDIAVDSDAKEEMRQIAGNPTQLPPYICNGTTKCGDYEEFSLAVDDEKLNEFLGLSG